MGLQDFLAGMAGLTETFAKKTERLLERSAQDNLRNARRKLDTSDRASVERYNEAVQKYKEMAQIVDKSANQRAELNYMRRLDVARSERDVHIAGMQYEQDCEKNDKNYYRRCAEIDKYTKN